MQKKVVKKKIILSFVIFLIILGVFSAVIVYLYSLQGKTKQKHDWLKNDISSKRQKINSLSDQAVKFAEAIGVWESFDEETKQLQGIRITPAKLVIDGLEAKYNLSNFKVVFSKPEDVNVNKYPELDNEVVTVSSSNVSIDFSAVTDEVVFNFLAELIESFPGYINIDTFFVERHQDIEKEHLEMIARGEYPALVNVKLRFILRDFKYTPPVEGTPPEGTEEG